MEAEKKAKELVDKFYGINNDEQSTLGTSPYISIEYAKQCALICVEEILGYDLRTKSEPQFVIERRLDEYWQEVKQAIQNL